jgi:hypothetical protein
MPDLYLLTSQAYPDQLTGSFKGYVIRAVEQREVIALEDRFHRQSGENISVGGRTLTIVPDVSLTRYPLQEQVTLVEFALYMLSASGSIDFQYAATFTGSTCTQAWKLDSPRGTDATFTPGVEGEGATKWIARCVLARGMLGNRFHISADRYVRYERAKHVTDGLLDLCICLESTLDTQTEIAFKFSILLGRLIGGRGENGDRVARILQKLYDLRSKIAHGDPGAARALSRLKPDLPELKGIARQIVTEYVLFTGDKTREEWQGHLRAQLFA